MKRRFLVMRNATTKWFNNGYGFLVDSETKEDVFVHYSNLIMDGYKSLHENDMVTYELGAGNDGRQQAINVKPILTMRMIEDSLKEDNLHVKEYRSSKDTAVMNTLGIDKGYMVVDENDVIVAGENDMTFLDLATYANFEIVQQSA